MCTLCVILESSQVVESLKAQCDRKAAADGEEALGGEV